MASSKVSRSSPDATEIRLERTVILGKGRATIVFRGTWGSSVVAIKRILSHDSHPILEDTNSNRIEQLKKLNHPNVIKILDAEEDDDFRYFVLELCLGTLYDYVRSLYKGAMPETSNALFQMASGLDYLHSMGFIHHGIKPENILITSEITLKISDFGLVRPISNRASLSMSSGSSQASPSCEAPELIREGENGTDDHIVEGSTAGDVFSLGCVWFSFLTLGGHPFGGPGGAKSYSIVPNILEGKSNLEGLDKEHFAAPIIERMIRSEPTQRIQLKEIIAILGSQQ